MGTSVRLVGAVLLAVLCAGCGPGAGKQPCSDDSSDILVLGDSIFRYHAEECASIPDIAGEALGHPMRSEARSGARVTAGGLYMFGDLYGQYEPGRWEWLVIEGGINDLRGRCGSERADEILDELVSADGADGEVPWLIDDALASGAQVALVGYYPVLDDAKFKFGDCNPELKELRERYTAAAGTRDGVIFVDPGLVVSPEQTPEAYLDDGVHPSEEGSRLVGELLAASMEEAGR